MKRAAFFVALLLVAGVASMGATMDPDRFIAQTQLDEDLVVLLPVDKPGTQLILAVVYVNERALEGRHMPAVREVLPDYVGKNAVLITAYSGRAVDWDHTKVTVMQDDAQVRADGDRVDPITDDFAGSRLAADRPVAGMLLLGDDIDPKRSFTVSYGDTASAVMEVRFEQVAAPEAEDAWATTYEEPSADDADEGEQAVVVCDEPSAEECRPCPPLFGCLAECADPCDPRGGIRAFLPLFFLLLLGP